MLDQINNVLFYIALFLLGWNAWFMIFNKGIPNIKTAPAIRKRMVELMRADMRTKGAEGYTIIDLGCGSGGLTRYFARTLPEARVIGIEIGTLPYMRAKLMSRMLGIGNVSYVNEDIYKTDVLSQADAVTMYLSGSFMFQIRDALERGLSANTLVLSNKFPIKGDWQPREEIMVETLYPHQKELYVYKT